MYMVYSTTDSQFSVQNSALSHRKQVGKARNNQLYHKFKRSHLISNSSAYRLPVPEKFSHLIILMYSFPNSEACYQPQFYSAWLSLQNLILGSLALFLVFSMSHNKSHLTGSTLSFIVSLTLMSD